MFIEEVSCYHEMVCAHARKNNALSLTFHARAIRSRKIVFVVLEYFRYFCLCNEIKSVVEKRY